jgi:hypothetical protein
MLDINIKKPFIIKNILPEESLEKIQKYAMKMWSTDPNYNETFGKHQWSNIEELKQIHNDLTNTARKYFDRKDILPSFNSLSIYEGKNAKLWKHKDDNACTYHLDICIFQKTPWTIFIEHEGKVEEYLLEENDGLFMYGNAQKHWRKDFPNFENNLVVNAFFFFVEPDHWWFTEGQQYIDVIRGKISKKDYKENKRKNFNE